MNEHENKIHDPRTYWLDNPGNVRKLVWAIFGVCVLLFLADAVYHKHSYFMAEDLFGFYAFYGFFVSVALVLIGRLMRAVLKRDEEYYDKDE